MFYHFRIAEIHDERKIDCPGDFIPEVKLVWTTGKTGVKVSEICNLISMVVETLEFALRSIILWDYNSDV